MKYILDTNTVSDLFQSDGTRFDIMLDHFRKLTKNDVPCISILSVFELQYGYENSPWEFKTSVKNKIRAIEGTFPIIHLSREQADIFGKAKCLIKEQKNLNKNSIKKYSFDLMIASTAIAERAVLVSADKIYLELAQFIPELIVEDWTQ